MVPFLANPIQIIFARSKNLPRTHSTRATHVNIGQRVYGLGVVNQPTVACKQRILGFLYSEDKQRSLQAFYTILEGFACAIATVI